jgi:hypothetical protein
MNVKPEYIVRLAKRDWLDFSEPEQFAEQTTRTKRTPG